MGRRTRNWILPFLVICALASCAADEEPGYVPVLATPSTNPTEPGSLQADFDAAARATSLEEAASLWQDLLRNHSPANGEYEDEFQKNFVDAAKLELIRIHYLLGQTEEGDAVLREMNLLQL